MADSDARWAAQVAAVAALQTSTDLQALNGGKGVTVGNVVPQDTQPPYILVGLRTSAPANMFQLAGRDVTVTFHIWTDELGDQQNLAIAAAMDAVLNRQWLTAPVEGGWGPAYFANEYADVSDDPSGLRHGVMRYRVTIQHA